MQDEQNRRQKYSENSKSYVKYSSMAFKMGAIILIGVLGGIKIDDYFNFEIPIFTLVLSIVFVILAIYVSIKDLIK